MTKDKNSRSIFMNAVENNSPDEWPVFLDQECGDDLELRGRVEELLQAHVDMGSVDQSDETLDQPFADMSGTQLGRYKLLQRIGEGGFGVVYMAEQLRPVKRKVALKVVKPGMDSKAVIARFEAERQALAMMDHPHIANVFDGGSTKEGRPYFVMELVKGVPVTTYCDDNRLSIRNRLELFVHVCEAVQHAHQKGIIHRDIKPSNVLVTLHDGKPVVKIIDFGVAKAMHSDLTEKTLFTAFGQMIGTPQYMSPEQAEMSGLDIDTRSDIYSLGVLLYEILTGTTPLEADEIRAAGLAEMQKLIKQQQTLRPSLRLSSAGERLTHLADSRSIDPRQLSREIRGDLDWIVMKALAKERERRYESAAGFSADVTRYLDNQAITARPPSIGYQLRKMAARHRNVVVATASVAFVTFLSLIVITLLLVQENRRRQQEAMGHYFANMSRAYQLWDENNYASVKQILTDVKTSPNKSFEWHLLWNATKRRRGALELPKFRDIPAKVRFYGDDKHLAVSDWGGHVRIFDLRNPNQPEFLFEESRPKDQAPGAKWLIPDSCSEMHMFGRWFPSTSDEANSSTLELVSPTSSSFQLHGLSPDFRMGFAKDGKLAFFCNGVQKSRIVDTELGSEVRRTMVGTLESAGIDGSLKKVAVSNNADLFAAVFRRSDQLQTQEEIVVIWSLTTDDIHCKVSIPTTAHSSVSGLEFSPDGHQLAVAAGRGGATDLVVLRTSDGKLLSGIGDLDTVRALAYSPDGSILASGSRDNSIKIWRTTDFQHVDTLRGHSGIITSLAFNSSGRQLVSASQDYTVVVWDVPNFHQPITEVNLGGQVRMNVRDQAVVYRRKDGVMNGFDLKTGGTIQADFVNSKADCFAVSPVRDVAVAHNSNVSLFRDGAFITSVEAVENVTAMTFSENGRQLALGTEVGTLHIWDLGEDELVDLDVAHDRRISRIAFSSDGKTLASTVGDDGRVNMPTISILMTNVETKGLQGELVGHLDEVHCLLFSPDGRWLVSSSFDNTIKVWDVANPGPPARELTGHTASVFRLLFTQQGDRLLSCGGDRVLRIWDWESGKQCGHIRVADDRNGVQSIDWLEDSLLVGSDQKGFLYKWDGRNLE